MKQTLKKLFEKYQIEYTNEILEKLELFYQITITENQKYNLTTITEKQEFAKKHIVDSLLFLNEFDETKITADIGTGAGFPAFPVKILKPEIDLTLIDSVSKKTNFQNLVINELKLEKIRAIHTRIEDFCLKNRNSFDIVTARAVASLPTLLEYSLPLLKIGGKLLAFKSKDFENEINLSKNALTVLGGKIIKIETKDLEDNLRCLIVVEKIKSTPEKYPRPQNKPRLKPL